MFILKTFTFFMCLASVSCETECRPDWFEDGWCDNVNNSPWCLYDGGDCCECTCLNEKYECGTEAAYDCIDPSSECQQDFSYSFSFSFDSYETECLPDWIGDGWCDYENNNPDCEYDQGDCCECKCVDAEYKCGRQGYACIEPDACPDEHESDPDCDENETESPFSGNGNRDIFFTISPSFSPTSSPSSSPSSAPSSSPSSSPTTSYEDRSLSTLSENGASKITINIFLVLLPMVVLFV